MREIKDKDIFPHVMIKVGILGKLRERAIDWLYRESGKKAPTFRRR